MNDFNVTACLISVGRSIHNLGPWCTKVRERKLVFLDDIWGSSRCLVSCACTFAFVMNRSDNDLGRIMRDEGYMDRA